MIDIHRASSSQKTPLVADETRATASFVIMTRMADGSTLSSEQCGNTPQLVARYDGSWDVRLCLPDEELPLEVPATSQSSPLDSFSWLRLSLPEVLSRLPERGAKSPRGMVTAAEQVLLPDLDVLVIAKPWHEPFANRQLVRPGRRTICVAVAGEYGGQYYDGPILHVRPDGDVASLIPSGGGATLRLTTEIVAGSRGIPWDEALTLDAMSDDKVHRCLLARVDAYLEQHRDESLPYELARPSASAPSVIVLLRQPRPEGRIDVHVSPEALGSHRGPWRRLGQNIGVNLADGICGKKSLAPAPRIPLPVHLIDESWVPPLIRSINRISDVIPRSLIP